MRKDGEPSVEEILASIKKVISRENRETAAEQRRLREQAAADTDELDEDDGVLDLTSEAEFACEEDEAETTAADGPLLDAAVRASMRDSFEALAMLSEPGARPQIVRSGETSLEGLVRDMLRPMLAQWLEANLPAMVEEMVAAEITRIAGKRG
jgi:cell pole-organizing protein PopZ